MIENLIKEMTLEEKIGQMTQLLPSFFGAEGEDATGPVQELGIEKEDIWRSGSVLGVTNPYDMLNIQRRYLERSRLGIPLLFMFDIIHGFRTIFPIPLALGCSWNPDAIRKMAMISGDEAAASGVFVTFSPMADLVRDPRWGRVMESTGEDGFLNGVMASAMVEGYQSNANEESRISACVKHFAAYGAVSGGRDYNTVDMSDWMLREYYLSAYKCALLAGADMVMASFTTVNGIPSTANSSLLRGMLRNEWGFDGVVISDWGSIGELINHGMAKDAGEAAKLAIGAGIDIDMMSGAYPSQLKKLVEIGAVPEESIDEAVRRILRLKVKRGLFKNPYGAADSAKAEEICLCANHRAAARDIASKSVVLLKNNGTLPLENNQRVALIGPFARSKEILGGWRALGKEEDTVSLFEGMRQMLDSEHLMCEEGCSLTEWDNDLAERAAMAVNASDVVVLAIGEGQDMTGEASCRSLIALPEAQERLVEMISSLGKPVAAVMFNGRPLDVSRWEKFASSIVEAWFPGTESGNALADILFGKTNPSGRLSMGFPRSVGQIPVYYNHFSTGRPFEEGSDNHFVSKYLDIPNEPMYPFGYGLSYTTFEHGPLQLSSAVLHDNGKITASVAIRNTGNREGVETAQLYLRDLCRSVVRPVMELKGFCQVPLLPGEEKTVRFDIVPEMLKFHNSKGELVSEAGEHLIMCGPSSASFSSIKFSYEP
jgi:beta-glucosidase